MGNLVIERTKSEHSERTELAYDTLLTEMMMILDLLREREQAEDLTRKLYCLLAYQGEKKKLGLSQAEFRAANDRIKRELQETDRPSLSRSIFESRARHT